MTTNPFMQPPPPRGLRRWLPGLWLLKPENARSVAHDLAAGLMLTAILVPVGMSYAVAAGLPAIHGLYASILPLLAYALFGPSRVLVLGPDSAMVGLIAATILPLAAGDPGRAASLAAAMAIVAGLACFLVGLLRLGFISDLLSKPIRYGYLNGIAVTVLFSQVPKILGFSVAGSNLVDELRGMARGLAEGKFNAATCVVGVVSLVIILVCKRRWPQFPGIVFVVATAAVASHALGLHDRFGVAVIGPMPSGFPAFAVPEVTLGDLRAVLAPSLAVALVAFTDTIVLSRALAMRRGLRADANQELVALGAANLATGLFQGFPVSGSSSRTPVAEDSGARTQLAAVTGALSVALLLMVAPDLLQHLPVAALAAIVVSACLGLVEVSGVARLAATRRSEFVLSLLCFLGVAALGVTAGIFLSVGLALAAFVWRAWRPHFAVLGHVEGLRSYHDIARHPEATLIPGLLIFRWDAPLFFANAEVFHDALQRAVATAPTRTRWVVVAAEPITDVDITAADMLADLDGDLKREGIELCFAEMKGPVKDRLKRYGLFAEIGHESFFPTIEHAVEQYRKVPAPPGA